MAPSEPDLPPETEDLPPEPESDLEPEEPVQPAGAKPPEELLADPDEAPSPAQAPAKPMLQQAYTVSVEGPDGETEFVAVGEDIGDAATSVVAALGEHGIEGAVVGIRFLTQALT